VKALTIRQPHASLVATGVKTIETRSRQTHHRGQLAIHAGMHRPTEGEDVGDWWWDWDVDEGVIVRRGDTWKQHPAPLGAIVAVADLVDCVPIVEDGWPANGAWRPALVIENDTLTLYRSDDPDLSEDADDQKPYGDFTPGRWAWLLADVRPLVEPVRCPGFQGIWDLARTGARTGIEAAVLAQVGQAVVS
jgi:hypothetical protein